MIIFHSALNSFLQALILFGKDSLSKGKQEVTKVFPFIKIAVKQGRVLIHLHILQDS